MNIGYFSDDGWTGLLPLTWLQAAFELTCGCDTLIDKMRRHLPGRLVRLWLRPELQAAVVERTALVDVDRSADWCALNARAVITGDLKPPAAGVVWRHNGEIMAIGMRGADAGSLAYEHFADAARLAGLLKDYRAEEPPGSIRLLRHPWELVLWNERELRRQCKSGGAHSGEVHGGVHMLRPADICIGAGAVIKPGVVLDAEAGPIHIEADVLIEPNAVVQGPCYLGTGTIVRPGAALRGGVTIGPVCKVGGEIEASIVQGYANKQHDGFLGHSYVAHWVNLGAGTVTSDLKNTYGAIRVFINGVGIETGQRFIGAFIADHAKTGIGTILPTGGVIGVAANVFTPGSVPKFVPSFSWLTADGMTPYQVDKAIQTARTVMGRRDVELSRAGRDLLLRTAEQARQVEAAGWS